MRIYIGDVYIGSTTKTYLSQRMEYHRRDYIKYKNNYFVSKITSFIIFDKYGVDNCRIILLENVNATCKNELLKEEAKHIKQIKCINKVVPLRTRKEYNDDHKEQAKEYYNKNKVRLSEKNICECGSSYSTYHKSRHFKTIKHQTFISKNI